MTSQPSPIRLSPSAGRRHPGDVATLRTLLWVVTAVCGSAAAPPRADAATTIDFARDIRPILSDHCYACHGPDEESRAAGLRLDNADDALAVITPGDAEQSELIRRILSDDVDVVMPPPETNKPIRPEQLTLLSRWIEEGAEFRQHWAFTPPVRPPVPGETIASWSRSPIDDFVSARWVAQDITPSPIAPDRVLIRRLFLDLTGLPPSPDQMRHWSGRLAAAAATDRPEAAHQIPADAPADAPGDAWEAVYAELVRTLLASPHYGEHWGRMWLDAARYADSDGYEKDKPRGAWFYRDWVIDSFNQDRPYNDFIIRQIAGDLLPGATQDDRVATGFLRNSMVNEEAGADPEQFRMEGIFDRMDAIGKSVLGLTVQCAQCHTHKYDPITQDEYYAMAAFINNTDDAIITVYDKPQQSRRQSVLDRIDQLETAARRRIPDWQQRLDRWSQSPAATDRLRQAWLTPPLTFLDSTISGVKYLPLEDGSYLAQSYAPTNFDPQATAELPAGIVRGVRLQFLPEPNLPRGGPGRSLDGTWMLSELTLSVALSGQPDHWTPVAIKHATADLSPASVPLKPRYNDHKPGEAPKQPRSAGPVQMAIDGDVQTAWTNETDTPRANQSQTAWFELDRPVEIPAGQTARWKIVMSQKHGGWNSDDNMSNAIGRFRVSFTADPLVRDDVAGDATIGDPWPDEVMQALGKSPSDRTPQDDARLFSFWRTLQPELKDINAEIEQLWQSHPTGTTQVALAQRHRPRETSVLNRGDFLSPLRTVRPGTPAFLHPLTPSDEPDRLRFARWLVADQSPTTARSLVNRVWQRYFGIGLVETSEDLGMTSTPASHPELLDHLAVELIENGWRLKSLHRQIVTSATYRQSSAVDEVARQRDPYNRMLARGARFRVGAEAVRDIALSASGLLCDDVGGPSVYPPAPAFLFQPPVSYGPKTWDEARDKDRYRRSMYTFAFRSTPYPMLEAFDGVPGILSCVRRTTSNTPLQSLTSLNEPVFMESAVALAASLPEADDDRRLNEVMMRCVQRSPSAEERATLLTFLSDQRKRIANGELDARRIVSAANPAVQTTPPDNNQPAAQQPAAQQPAAQQPAADEVAAWTLLCRVILNLDETITRE